MNKSDVGSSRPLSHGLVVNKTAKQQAQDLITERIAEFLADSKNKIDYVDFGVMKKDTKGSTALRINKDG